MGLRQNDLEFTIDNIFEIDSFKSKMGDDKNIVVMSLSARTKESANDLMNFIEKGYPFVLDADATAGEQSDGTYKVFVEIERDKNAGANIMELANGMINLTGREDFRFRYHKEFRSQDLTQEALEEVMPLEPDMYGVDQKGMNEDAELNNYKNWTYK